MDVGTLALAISSFVFSVGSLAVSGWLWVNLEAQKRSTHKVQLVPVDELKSFSMEDEIEKAEKERQAQASEKPYNQFEETL